MCSSSSGRQRVSERVSGRRSDLHDAWLERRCADVRGQEQTSLCSLLALLETELPQELARADGDCRRLDRDRAARRDKIRSLLEVRGGVQPRTRGRADVSVLDG